MALRAPGAPIAVSPFYPDSVTAPSSMQMQIEYRTTGEELPRDPSVAATRSLELTFDDTRPASLFALVCEGVPLPRQNADGQRDEQLEPAAAPAQNSSAPPKAPEPAETTAQHQASASTSRFASAPRDPQNEATRELCMQRLPDSDSLQWIVMLYLIENDCLEGCALWEIRDDFAHQDPRFSEAYPGPKKLYQAVSNRCLALHRRGTIDRTTGGRYRVKNSQLPKLGPSASTTAPADRRQRHSRASKPLNLLEHSSSDESESEATEAQSPDGTPARSPKRARVERAAPAAAATDANANADAESPSPTASSRAKLSPSGSDAQDTQRAPPRVLESKRASRVSRAEFWSQFPALPTADVLARTSKPQSAQGKRAIATPPRVTRSSLGKERALDGSDASPRDEGEAGPSSSGSRQKKIRLVGTFTGRESEEEEATNRPALQRTLQHDESQQQHGQETGSSPNASSLALAPETGSPATLSSGPKGTTVRLRGGVEMSRGLVAAFAEHLAPSVTGIVREGFKALQLSPAASDSEAAPPDAPESGPRAESGPHTGPVSLDVIQLWVSGHLEAMGGDKVQGSRRGKVDRVTELVVLSLVERGELQRAGPDHYIRATGMTDLAAPATS